MSEDLQAKKNVIASGARWFYWIGGLSLVNTIAMLMEAQFSFIAGLAITQFVDGVFMNFSSPMLRLFGALINFGIMGFFIFLGKQALGYKKWAFITGMVLYSLDALIYLAVGDFLGFGFHIFALFFIFLGLKNLIEVQKEERINSKEFKIEDNFIEE